MKCTNCGAGNGDNDDFCASCGASLEEATAPGESIEEKEWNGTSTGKKSRAPVIAVVAVLILLLGAGSFFGYAYYKSKLMTPEERLIQGLTTIVEAERGEIHSTVAVDQLDLKTNNSDAAMIQDLLQDIVIDSVVKYDIDAMQVEVDLNLKMMGTSLVTLATYLDRDTLMLDIPLIYDKALYIKWDDLIEMVQGPFIDNLIYGSMMGFGMDVGMEEMPEATIATKVIKGAAEMVVGLFNKDQYKSYSEIDRTVYNELIGAYLVEVVREIEEGSFEVNGEPYEGFIYHVVYNEQESKTLMEDLLEEMSEDTQVMTFLEEVVTIFVSKIVEEENYILYAILMEEDSEGIIAWDNVFAGELEVKKSELIEEMKDGLKNAKVEMQGAVDEASDQAGMDVESVVAGTQMIIDFKMDQEDVLRSQETTITMDLSTLNDEAEKAIISIISDYHQMDGDVVFEGVDVNTGVDVGSLSDEELMTLFGEIQNNVMENIMSNPMFSDLFILGY